MNYNNDEYPKELITIEKISEDAKEFEKIITIVSNEYEEEAVNVAIAYQAAFNARDGFRCDELFNYPHIRLGTDDEIQITEKPHSKKEIELFFKSFIEIYGWNHSCLEKQEVIHSSPKKVHLSIKSSRYKKDGTKIITFSSFWVITNQKGHWGIKMRSSYAP